MGMRWSTSSRPPHAVFAFSFSKQELAMNNPVPPDHALVVQWMFGAAVVIFYAWDRFKNPVPTRPTTTFLRYWFAACGYAVAMLALFVFLGGGITSVNLKAMEDVIGSVPDGLETLPGPLLSALLLTSLLPHSPVLAKVDESIKQWFWRVGNIPTEVRGLSARLEGALYEPSDRDRESLATVFRTYDANPAWLAEPARSLKLRSAHCLVLLGQVQRWEDARGFARYVRENKAALAAICLRLSALAPLLNEQTLTELDGGGDSRLLSHVRKNIEAELGSLWRALCDFVAGGVLSATISDRQQRAALTRLGFTGLPQERNPLNAHDIVLVGGLVSMAMLFIPLMMNRFFNPEPLELQARVLIMVPIIYVIAIVVAIYPKAAWPFAIRASGGARPVAAYALSGVVGAAAAFLVSVLFRFAFDTQGNVFQAFSTPEAFAKAWSVSLERWPWLLMSFFATVAIAWAADDYHPSVTPAPKWLPWAEAAALAVTFGVLQWTVAQLLIGIVPDAAAAKFKAKTPQMVITASVIGACIGFLVPSLYRSKSQGRLPQADLPAPLPAA
jgi:hypothetical protein